MAATADAPRRRHLGGDLQAAGTFADRTGYVRMRWSDCAYDPEVGFVGG